MGKLFSNAMHSLERIPCGEAGQLRSLLQQPVQVHLTFSEKKREKKW